MQINKISLAEFTSVIFRIFECRKMVAFPVHLFYSHKTYLDNEIDVHPLKPVSTAFIAFQRAKKSG